MLLLSSFLKRPSDAMLRLRDVVMHMQSDPYLGDPEHGPERMAAVLEKMYITAGHLVARFERYLRLALSRVTASYVE